MKTADKLLTIQHPYYINAVIDLSSVCWILKCPNCGTKHQILMTTHELDPCCKHTPIVENE